MRGVGSAPIPRRGGGPAELGVARAAAEPAMGSRRERIVVRIERNLAHPGLRYVDRGHGRGNCPCCHATRSVAGSGAPAALARRRLGIGGGSGRRQSLRHPRRCHLRSCHGVDCPVRHAPAHRVVGAAGGAQAAGHARRAGAIGSADGCLGGGLLGWMVARVGGLALRRLPTRPATGRDRCTDAARPRCLPPGCLSPDRKIPAKHVGGT